MMALSAVRRLPQWQQTMFGQERPSVLMNVIIGLVLLNFVNRYWVRAALSSEQFLWVDVVLRLFTGDDLQDTAPTVSTLRQLLAGNVTPMVCEGRQPLFCCLGVLLPDDGFLQVRIAELLLVPSYCLVQLAGVFSLDNGPERHVELHHEGITLRQVTRDDRDRLVAKLLPLVRSNRDGGVAIPAYNSGSDNAVEFVLLGLVALAVVKNVDDGWIADFLRKAVEQTPGNPHVGVTVLVQAAQDFVGRVKNNHVETSARLLDPFANGVQRGSQFGAFDIASKARESATDVHYRRLVLYTAQVHLQLESRFLDSVLHEAFVYLWIDEQDSALLNLASEEGKPERHGQDKLD